MDVFLPIVFWISFILIWVFLYKKKKNYSALMALVTIVSFVANGIIVDEKDARKEGFLSAIDKDNALSEGITEPKEWDKKRDGVAARKQAEVDEFRKNATVKKRTEENCENMTMAFVISQEPVLRALKSPSTAVFPLSSQSVIVKKGECRFGVKSYVDAQNSFGAMIRNNYSVIVTYYPLSDKWTTEDFKMSN